MISKIKNHFKKRAIKKAQIKEYLRSIPSAYDNKIISWVAPEHVRYQRGTLWKVIIGIFLITSIGLGIYYNAWTFSLAVSVFVIAYYLIHRDHPNDVEISISDIGIKVGHRKYPFSRIKSFWLMYEPPHIRTLNIKVHGELAVDISIQLNHQDPSKIREFLIEKIPEKEGHQESFSDIFARLLKI